MCITYRFVNFPHKDAEPDYRVDDNHTGGRRHWAAIFILAAAYFICDSRNESRYCSGWREAGRTVTEVAINDLTLPHRGMKIIADVVWEGVVIPASSCQYIWR